MTGVFRFSLLASILSLSAALLSQYGFGLKPCHLCVIQRVPYVVVIILSLAALAMHAIRKRGMALLIAAAFLSGAGVAGYHAGVEKHIFPGPSSCTSSATPGQSIDDLLQKIKGAPIVACDQAQWEFHGVTFALLNMVWSLVLALYVVVMARKKVDDA